MSTPNLKFILETILEDQPRPISKEEKRQFISQIANFSELGNSIYGRTDLEQTVNRVKHIVDKAAQIMQEKDDEHKIVGFKKVNTRLFADYKDFEQAARDLKEAQERMSLCYEQIGNHLETYFNLG
jgi:hypothetical protein